MGKGRNKVWFTAKDFHECCLSNSHMSFPVYAVHCVCTANVYPALEHFSRCHTFHINVTGLLLLCHQAKQTNVKPRGFQSAVSHAGPMSSLLDISCSVTFSSGRWKASELKGLVWWQENNTDFPSSFYPFIWVCHVLKPMMFQCKNAGCKETMTAVGNCMIFSSKSISPLQSLCPGIWTGAVSSQPHRAKLVRF